MNILIVDDNDDSRIYLERGLGSQGYTVIVADNGRDALQKLKNCEVDVIISDIMMPVMDGFELCKKVKSDDDLSRIAFIFYTATFTEDKDREFGMSLGASAFIVKPIPPNQFFEIIKDILGDYENKRLEVCIQIDVDGNKLDEQYVKTITRKLEKKIKDLEKEKLALKESEEKFRNIFEQSAVGLAHLTPEGKFLLINKCFSTILGYTLNELKELHLKDITHPDYIEAGIANAKKLLSNEINTYSVEKRCIRKDGSIVWVYLTVSLVRDENDYPKYFLLVIEDISKRKEDEKEINMLGHAIKSIRESVCVTDLNENVIFVNDAFLHTYGFEREEILGRPIGTIKSQKNEPEIINSILSETLTQGGWQGEIISQKKDGNEFHSLLSKSLIYDENKVAVAVVEVLKDISERIKLEEQLRQSKKMETVGNLAGGIAHDFNNLLTVINGYTELVLMKYGDHEDDSMHRQLEEILNAGKRAEKLTQQLLIFSRREMSRPTILEMGKIVRGIEKMLNRLIGDNIELISDIVTDHDYFYADQGQIEQILTNLIVNARDAMSGAGKIVIKSQSTEIKKLILSGDDEIKPGRYLVLNVSDTGCGMSKETITKIFDPFFTTKQVGQGTGFGLSTVYGIVKKWRGFIDVTSEIGEGTTFNIYFPSAKEQPEGIETVKQDVKVMSGNETVLVAEDEDDVRNLVCHVLGMNGYKILEAPHGGSALLKCEQFKDDIHLILCDVVMPEMDGVQLVKRLQALHPEMKIIFMSGYIDNAGVVDEITEKSVDFLQKPFSPDSLLKKIRDVLD